MAQPLDARPARKKRKSTAGGSPRRGVDPLTCTEEQVEALLSKGESTEPLSTIDIDSP